MRWYSKTYLKNLLQITIVQQLRYFHGYNYYLQFDIETIKIEDKN